MTDSVFTATAKFLRGVGTQATVSVAVPFMAIYNNLVLFDQNVARNSLDSVVPDLATSWTWSDDGTAGSLASRPKWSM